MEQKKVFFCRMLSLAAAMLLALTISAQSTINGHVKDETGEGVIGASIVVKGTQGGTVTDLDGHFSISNSRGLVAVTVQSVGYKTQHLTLRTGRETKQNIVLEPEVYALADVVIKPKKQREHYRRKGNPAVELIKNVIAHKTDNRIGGNDDYKKRTYEKLLMAIDPFDYDLEKSKFRQQFLFLPFLLFFPFSHFGFHFRY